MRTRLPHGRCLAVAFTIPESCVVAQTIVAGLLEKLKPTANEGVALGVPVSLPLSTVGLLIDGARSRNLPLPHARVTARVIRSPVADARDIGEIRFVPTLVSYVGIRGQKYPTMPQFISMLITISKPIEHRQ
jgi:hypothetical protein